MDRTTIMLASFVLIGVLLIGTILLSGCIFDKSATDNKAVNNTGTVADDNIDSVAGPPVLPVSNEDLTASAKPYGE